MSDQPTTTPTRKVTAAALGGACATIVCWVVTAVTGTDIPVGVEGSAATIFAFLAGYIVRD